ncbi:hypothetical protein KKD03_02670 [Patescibacteria group bacterium]|nr:hypothetical protein [Patescibacteria group bacterium]
MQEGGRGIEESRNVELSAHQVEGITIEVLKDEELIQYLKEKIAQKINFKQAVTNDDGTNDFSEWKRLGMFIVNWKRLPDSLVSILQSNGVDIMADEVLELHIPPQSASFEEFQQSLNRLKEYLNSNRSNKNLPRYVYGVSYLAKYAGRWGFTIIDLPDFIQGESGAAGILRDYAESVEDPKKQRLAHKFKIDDIKLCYISVDDLLKR